MKISNFSTYLKALVQVEAEGFFVERLINLCRTNNIKIWDITYINEGKIRFSISPKEFKKIKVYVKKSKCKIKVVNKKGIYFNMFKYRKRRIAIYVCVGLILSVFIFSSFIWKINIIAEGAINESAVEELLCELKVSKGTNKLFISKGKISDYIRANMYEASWVGVDILGTTMNITVKEKIISKEEDNTNVGNIIATKSCIISKIIAQNGTAKYKTGSYIEKGDVAIEGIITSELIDPIYVHANGILKGIVDYEYNGQYKYKEKIKENVGKSRYGVGIGINNKEILIKYLPKQNKYDINSKAKIFNIFSVDISFIFNTYDEYILKDITYTKEELIRAW